MKKLTGLIIILITFSCRQQLPSFEQPIWSPYDETEEIESVADHDIARMHLKLIQSKHLDKTALWKVAYDQIQDFSETKYQRLKPYILEKNILEIQSAIDEDVFSYEDLTKWYLYRILKFENNPDKSLHSIISINPNAVAQAKDKDRQVTDGNHLIYGMPILLKDNINTAEMKTTAGAHVLRKNQTQDAFIVKQMKSKGAIILGKVNMSEWAYYFCGGCPVGYSAIGGQTLNPYGRKIFECGGSSSGSGTTMAANYAVAAIGTETSGSILSPSGQNSVVGLKPTIGLLSRSGIVPISSTLDTPGPMTRNVIDNSIFLSAIKGEDTEDPITLGNTVSSDYNVDLTNLDITKFRFGANQGFIDSDSLYRLGIDKLKKAGAQVFIFEPEQVKFEGFSTLLDAEMKRDLPKYLSQYAGSDVDISSVKDVIEYNLTDTSLYAPYGQARLEGSSEDSTSKEELAALITNLRKRGRNYFDTPTKKYQLDVVMSINNYNAGHSAMANYPSISIPLGYDSKGEPENMTFTAKPFEEQKLLKIGYAFEQIMQARKMPMGYD